MEFCEIKRTIKDLINNYEKALIHKKKNISAEYDKAKKDIIVVDGFIDIISTLDECLGLIISLEERIERRGN